MYSTHEGTHPITESAIRFFASSHQLSQLAPRTRILCVLFLLGILSQAISGILMHHHGAGWTPTSISLYYRGSEAPATANHAAFGIDAPDNPSATPTPTGRIAIARSYGTLLEVAHLHLVAMPLILFIVAHLFSMTPSGKQRWAGALCYGSFVAAAADILTPFALRYGSSAFAPVKLAAFLALEASLVAMVLVTLCAALASFRSLPTNPGSATFSRAD